MSRVLIFGGDGLLGSHLYLSMKNEHDLCLTLHGSASAYPPRLFSGARVEPFVAAEEPAAIAAVIDAFRPDWVINAVGLVKRGRATDPLASLEANTVFPHRLARLCAERSARLLHFSTDCVYSGRTGMYAESDVPDSQDWHGRCKALGEPVGQHVLVLRTSFIGLELGCKKSLVEWFLSQRGAVPGYTKAIWSGLTAMEVGRVAGNLVGLSDPLQGLWHLAVPPISKYTLLSSLNERLGKRGVTVVADDSFVCDRSLNGSAFTSRAGYLAPGWNQLLDELAEDVLQRWRPDAPSYWQG